MSMLVRAHYFLYSMFGAILPSANGVPQTPMIAMACSATHHQLVHMYWSTGRGGVWTHNPEDCNLKPNHLASRSW